MRLLTGSLLVVAAGSIAMLLHAGEVASKPKTPDQKAAPVVAAGAVDPDRNLPHDNNYIVHEWGTFTSFSGSDGIALDFRPLVGEDLPKFVLDRAHQAALNDRRAFAATALLFTKSSTVSRQRMETPVTYFYTDQERIVDVKVDFPNGLLTEFYPPVRQFGPDYKKDVAEPLSKSWLSWGKVRLIPEDRVLNKDGVDPFIPQISGDPEVQLRAQSLLKQILTSKGIRADVKN